MSPTRKAKVVRPPKTFDEYLSRVGPDKQAALRKLRKAIRAAVPGCTECISYGLPAFRLNGRFFVGIAAGSRQCSFYLGSTVQSHRDELKGFETSKGTIRFMASDPPAASLVRKLLRDRIAENPRFGEDS